VAAREGDDLKTAVQRGFSELDGFFTFFDGHRRELSSCRAPSRASRRCRRDRRLYRRIARSSAHCHLPHISHATLFEPKPEEIYHGELRPLLRRAELISPRSLRD